MKSPVVLRGSPYSTMRSFQIEDWHSDDDSVEVFLDLQQSLADRGYKLVVATLYRDSLIVVFENAAEKCSPNTLKCYANPTP